MHKFKLGRNVSETAFKVNEAWGADTTIHRLVRRLRLFSKLHGGNVDIGHQPIAGCPVLCNTLQLRREADEAPTSTVRELSSELAVLPVTVSRHLEAMGKVKKLDTRAPHEHTE